MSDNISDLRMQAALFIASDTSILDHTYAESGYSLSELNFLQELAIDGVGAGENREAISSGTGGGLAALAEAVVG